MFLDVWDVTRPLKGQILNATPRVTIGLAVFNGEEYLAETLESILAQSYSDFWLLICDNASTDQTPRICREYAENDSRIRYYRNEKNVGGPENFNRVFRLSSTEYFKWASADDVYSPTYLQRCIDVLDSDPTLMVCHCKAGRIDDKGRLIGNYDWNTSFNMASRKPHIRFQEFLSIRNAVWALYGLTRSSFLKETPLHRSYMDSDRNLIAEIALRGRIYEIPEYLFFGREHSHSYTMRFYGDKSTTTEEKQRQQMAWWNQSGWNAFHHAKICLEYFKSVIRVKISWSEKFRCFDQIFRWFFKEGWLLIFFDFESLLLQRSPKAYRLLQTAKYYMKRALPQMVKITAGK